MKHTFQCHSSAPNFRHSCGISGCIQTFKTFSAICSHIQRRHPCYDLDQRENETGDQERREGVSTSQLIDDVEEMNQSLLSDDVDTNIVFTENGTVDSAHYFISTKEYSIIASYS